MAGTSDLVAEIEALAERLQNARTAIAGRFIGQDRVVDLTLAALMAGGHALLVGLPGLGKTRLVDTLATVMGLQGNRIQFTPDLMPADILGSEVLETASDGSRSFRFIEGPVFKLHQGRKTVKIERWGKLTRDGFCYYKSNLSEAFGENPIAAFSLEAMAGFIVSQPTCSFKIILRGELNLCEETALKGTETGLPTLISTRKVRTTKSRLRQKQATTEKTEIFFNSREDLQKWEVAFGSLGIKDIIKRNLY